MAGPLAALAKWLPEIPPLQFNLVMCPLPANCADAVVLLNVLEHIAEDVPALKHVQRILRPSGLAVINVSAGPNCLTTTIIILIHHRRYTMAELRAKVAEAGLTVVREVFCLWNPATSGLPTPPASPFWITSNTSTAGDSGRRWRTLGRSPAH